MAFALRRGRTLLTSPTNSTRRLVKNARSVRFCSAPLAYSSSGQDMAAPESTAAMPPMMYGTAWKKERTADLVYEAIKAGFRGIDTAAMKKHYDEALAGEGIRRAIREGIVSRRDLFIQTKFTPYDPTSPYSPTDPIPAQIHSSVASSLANLSPHDASADADNAAPYFDALLLHSPFPSLAETLEAWAALQSYLPGSPDPSRRGRILRLGISNVTLPVLQALSSSTSPSLSPPPSLSSSPASSPPSPSAPYPPQIVQNRFRAAERDWDRDVRAWVSSLSLPPTSSSSSSLTSSSSLISSSSLTSSSSWPKYQGFWTLTGNPRVWQRPGSPFVRELADRAGISPAAAWYVLLMEAGVVVLNGTCDPAHMREDLAARRAVDEMRRRRGAAGPEDSDGEEVWRRCWAGFRRLIGDGGG